MLYADHWIENARCLIPLRKVSGIEVGDVIKGIYGKPINKYSLFKIHRMKKPGDIITLTVDRNGQEIKFDVKLGYVYVERRFYNLMPIYDTIFDILTEPSDVRLTIMIGQINFHAVESNAPGFESWKKSTEIEVLSDNDQRALREFKTFKNFALIDRHQIKKVLEEHKLSMEGYVSEETRNIIGEMLGVTHILIISITRYNINRGGWKDVEYQKLIEIDTGKILVSTQMTRIHKK